MSAPREVLIGSRSFIIVYAEDTLYCAAPQGKKRDKRRGAVIYSGGFVRPAPLRRSAERKTKEVCDDGKMRPVRERSKKLLFVL